MVSDLNIVTGDLEALSTDVSNVATEISGVNVTTDMADAPSAMPGSSSAGSITSAASAIEGRRSSAQTCYEDFSADVTTAGLTPSLPIITTASSVMPRERSLRICLLVSELRSK